MTAPVIEAPPVEDPEADWAVVLRLLWHRPLGATVPSAADLHLAIWLLLDLGHESDEIRARLGVAQSQIKRVMYLRRMAATPPSPQRQRMGRPLLDYRQFAPTALERRLLSVDGITRPE
jgi:hypothetical protein